MKNAMTKGIIVGGLHLVLQLSSWAMHPGGRASPGQLDVLAERLWELLRWPLFAIVGEPIGTMLFIPIVISNSLVWGSVAAAMMRRRNVRVDVPNKAVG